jgi:hypothetical protein
MPHQAKYDGLIDLLVEALIQEIEEEARQAHPGARIGDEKRSASESSPDRRTPVAAPTSSAVRYK